MDNENLLTPKKIANFLATTELFANISSSILNEIATELKVIYLAGGDVLFEQDETADSLYVIIYGYVNVLKKEPNNKQTVIAALKRGSVVGEIACIVDVKRTATVYAVRDSILLQMSRETFDILLQKYPLAMMGITRQCVKRLVSPSKSNKSDSASCFCLATASNFSGLTEFSHKFIENLNQYGTTFLLTQSIFDDLYGKDSAQTPLNSDKSAEIISWIHELESKYRFIVYVAEELNPWALRCFRQSDKVLLIGNHEDSRDLNELENALFKNPSIKTLSVDLVLTSNSSSKFSSETQQWLKNRKITQHYNMRVGIKNDYDRFIRLITGNGIGLVMAGGGALALAHIGLIRALEEFKIPIDYIGGTSMGALIGGLLAMEYNYESIIKILKNVLYQFSTNLDYTLPISALTKGRILGELMRDSYGEQTRIEDLWQKFFCISTNLSSNDLCIHESSLLWKSIRASVSLPAIFPPVHDEYNSIYVDGGILNNLPVDIMQERIYGGKIIASSLKIHSNPKMNLEEDSVSGWYLFFKHILLPKFWKSQRRQKKDFVNIASVIHRSMILGSHKHQEAMLARADYKLIMDLKLHTLLNFKPMQEIIDEGYRQAVQMIKNSNLIDYSKN